MFAAAVMLTGIVMSTISLTRSTEDHSSEEVDNKDRNTYSKICGVVLNQHVTISPVGNEVEFSDDLLVGGNGSWFVRNRNEQLARIEVQGRLAKMGASSWLYARSADGVWHTFKRPSLAFSYYVRNLPVKYKVLSELRNRNIILKERLTVFSDKKLFGNASGWYIRDLGQESKIVMQGDGRGYRRRLLHCCTEDGKWHAFGYPSRAFKEYVASLPLKLDNSKLSYDGKNYYTKFIGTQMEKIVMQGVSKNPRLLYAVSETGKQRRLTNTFHLKPLEKYMMSLPKTEAACHNHLLVKTEEGHWGVKKNGKLRRLITTGHRLLMVRAETGQWVLVDDISPSAYDFLETLPQEVHDPHNIFSDHEREVSLLEEVNAELAARDNATAAAVDT